MVLLMRQLTTDLQSFIYTSFQLFVGSMAHSAAEVLHIAVTPRLLLCCAMLPCAMMSAHVETVDAAADLQHCGHSFSYWTTSMMMIDAGTSGWPGKVI